MNMISSCRSTDPAGTNFLRFVAVRGQELRRLSSPPVSRTDEGSQARVRRGDFVRPVNYARFERLPGDRERTVAGELVSLPAGFARAALTALTDMKYVGGYYDHLIEPVLKTDQRGELASPLSVVGLRRTFSRLGQGDLRLRACANVAASFVDSVPGAERETWDHELLQRYYQDHLLTLLPPKIEGCVFYIDGLSDGDLQGGYGPEPTPPLPNRKAVLAYLETQVDPVEQLSVHFGPTKVKLTGLLAG